jgi:hypothetical protein
MGLFKRWGDRLEEKNVTVATNEIVDHLKRFRGAEQGLDLPEIRRYVVGRSGWTEL